MQAFIAESPLQSLQLVIIGTGGIDHRIDHASSGQKVGKLSGGTKLGYPRTPLARKVALADFKLVLDLRQEDSSCRL